MTGTFLALDVAGHIVLLLWGMRMVQSGVERAFGSDLRRVLGRTLRNRLVAAFAGAGVTMLLQSSTATAMMVTSFAARGAVDLIPALAIMLGANVGTALTVKALSFDVSWVSPVLLIVGQMVFTRSPKGRYRDLGRVGIGLGLMLLSLHLVVSTIEPVGRAPVLQQVLTAVTGDPVLDVLLAAALTFAAHSSAAIILPLAGLAAGGAITPVAGIALVLGANLGSALPPVFETSGSNPASRRVPVGNLLFRGLGCVIVLPFLHPLADALWRESTSPVVALTTFHLALNLILAVVCIGLLGPAGALISRCFPEKVKSGVDRPRPVFLALDFLETPYLALDNAAREILRMGDLVEVLLRLVPSALEHLDKRAIEQAKRVGRELDLLHDAVRGYLARLEPAGLTGRDLTRLSDLVEFAVNLGHAGDILERDLTHSGSRSHRTLTKAERMILLDIQAKVVAELRLALSTMMTEDSRSARDLINAKRKLNALERAASRDHLAGLGSPDSAGLEASAFFLAMLHDLKLVNSHLATIGYAVGEPSSRSDSKPPASPIAGPVGPQPQAAT